MTKPSDKSILNEQAVATSAERLAALVTATSDIIYIMSADWREMRQLDGRNFLSDTHEPITDWLPKYIYPQDEEKIKAAIDEAIREKKIFQMEHRVQQADGTLGWTLSRAVPILNEKKEIIEWFGTASDITDRKLAEEALREEKERSEQQKRLYETITSGTPDLVYVFDLDYRFTYANSALLSMWGKTWDNAVGKRLLENGYEPWHAEMHEREIDQVRTTKQPIRGEVSFPHAAFGRRIYDYIFTPILNDNGEVEAVAGTTRDITDIRNAETAISESEERFRTMAEGTDILIAVGDETGRAIYYNQAWSSATGRSADDLVNIGWTDLMHPDDKQRILTTFAIAFEKKAPFNWEFRMPNQQGGYNWLLAKGTPRFRSDSSFAGYISSCVDITERKQWELKLESSTEELQSINEEMASSNEELASTNEELTATNEELLRMQQELQHQTAEKQDAIDRLNANEQNIRNMVRQAPVGMCIVEGDPLFVVEINDSFLEIIGKTREELRKRPYWEVIAEAAAYYKPITDNVLATGKTYHAKEHEILLIREGIPETVYVDFVYEPMIDFQGKPYAIMIVAIEITDMVLARRKVEQAEESLRMAVDAAELGTYYINATDRIFHPSPRLKEFFGFKPDEEVPYDAAINQIHPDYRKKAADMVEAAFTKGERFDMEYPVVGHHDGNIRWVRGIGTMQHYNGKDFFTGVLHEITERKQDEMRKNDFIGMVSHELKTPLTSLNAIIQVANTRLKNSEDQF